MFIKKYGDLVVGVFFAVISIIMIIAAYALPASTVMDIGPDFMPLCISWLTLALAIILIVQSVIKLVKDKDKEVEVTDKPDYKRVIISFILVLAYVFLMKPIGFIISTIVYLPLQMLVLAPEDGRKPVFLIIISVVFTLGVFFLFRYGFSIILPAGIFTIDL